MPPLRDESTITRFRLAFEERNSGGVLWRANPGWWIRKNLDGCSTREIDCLIQDHIADGREIDQVVETREEYRHSHDYHYDFRIPVSGRLIYIETVLDEIKMGPRVTIVSVHDA
jgi:hypothetical protein